MKLIPVAEGVFLASRIIMEGKAQLIGMIRFGMDCEGLPVFFSADIIDCDYFIIESLPVESAQIFTALLIVGNVLEIIPGIVKITAFI